MPVVQKQTDPRKIFQDSSGARRIVWNLVWSFSVIAALLWSADFFYRVYTLNALPPLDYTVFDHDPSAEFEETGLGRSVDCEVSASEARVFGYLPFGDAKAAAGLATHCDQIDAVLYEGYTFDEETGSIAAIDRQLVSLPDGVLPYPVIRPEIGTGSYAVNAMLGNPVLRNGFMNNLKWIGRATSAAGVCIDLSGHSEVEAGSLTTLLRGLSSDPASSARDTCVIGQMDASFWDDPALIDQIDRAVVIGFREGGLPSAPLAPQPWFELMLAQLNGKIPSEKMVVALGNYGSLTQSGDAALTRLSYAEVMWLTNRFDGEIGFAEGINNTIIQFLDEDRHLNQIWLLDGVSMYNQMQAISGQNVAVWPLGYEDPSVWNLLQTPSIAALEQPIDLGTHVVTTGDGPLSRFSESAVLGQRSVSVNDGLITAQTYEMTPLPVTVSRYGEGTRADLVVTFNGFGEPELMESVFAVLDTKDIDATFFVTEMELLENKAMVTAIEAQGHTFGSVSDYNDGLFSLAPVESQLALNAMQHLLAHLTEHRSVYVRDLSGRLEVFTGVRGLQRLSELSTDGYLLVSGGISPLLGDFDVARFRARTRLASVESGTVVVSFDLTSQAAEDVVMPFLESLDQFADDGFQFTSLQELADMDEAALMPMQQAQTARDGNTYELLHFWYFKLSLVFVILITLAIVRALIYLILAYVRRPFKDFDSDFRPGVTVLVPAFNEANVIERCLKSILKSDYPNFQVIVIDDGSSDHTADVVNEKFGHDPRISLLQQENHGKWRAENHALGQVTTPIFIGVDADTILLPNAISWLVQQFKDEKVGAVAGFVEVGNRRNFLTACQTLEYLVSQAFSRRAFEVFGGILVVPGAIGAWRTDAVRKAGMYSGNTITEDADLTISVHRAGYEVRFQEQARAITEAPESVSAFLKQRLRWVLGMLQTSWKHRGAIMEGRTVGYISIVDAIWFSLFTSLLSPIVDFLLIGIAVKTVYALATGGPASFGGFPFIVLATYFILVGIDMINTLVAFHFERRFDWKLLLLVPVLRFGYRQLIYISSIHAMLRAVTGRLAGWNKLSRKNSMRKLKHHEKGT